MSKVDLIPGNKTFGERKGDVSPHWDFYHFSLPFDHRHRPLWVGLVNQKISEGKNSAPHSGQSFVNHMSSKVLLEHNMRMIEGTFTAGQAESVDTLDELDELNE